jgi:hypothetical protein
MHLGTRCCRSVDQRSQCYCSGQRLTDDVRFISALALCLILQQFFGRTQLSIDTSTMPHRKRVFLRSVGGGTGSVRFAREAILRCCTPGHCAAGRKHLEEEKDMPLNKLACIYSTRDTGGKHQSIRRNKLLKRRSVHS